MCETCEWALEDVDQLLTHDEDETDLDEADASDALADADMVDLIDGLRSALREEYLDATDDDLEEALLDMFESISLAESLNLAKAIRQIEHGATRAMSDPLVAQIASTGAPILGGALGTAALGPGAGTLIGSGVGTAAARALPSGRQPPPLRPAATSGMTSAGPPPLTVVPPLSAGSPAATQALVLSQHPQAIRDLLAVALGDRGRTSAVGPMMSLLSSVFSQAAADADEMLWTSQRGHDRSPDTDSESIGEPAVPAQRAAELYSVLMAAENEALEEAMGWI